MLDQYFCILNAVTTASKYMQTESNPDGKITVLLEVFGRQTPVQVDHSEVSKVEY